jgi:peptide/nickel transport system substrate-binding protein
MLMLVSMLLAACAAPEAEIVEVTRVVEKEVEVTKIVEGETVVETVVETVIETVIETVEVEVEAEATPVPLGPEGQKRGGTAVMGFYQEPEMLNPYIRTQTVAGIAGDFMERGLLLSDPDGDWIPDLAIEVPTIENGGVSEDGLTITYNLKEGIVWSDGTPFTCSDVQFTWEAIVHPESGAVTTTGYDLMESVSCPDDYTVVVQYTEFYAPYLSRFGSIMPRHATGDPADMQNWVYNRFPISLGPFKIDEWVSGDHMTLERNERYELWESEGKPYLDAIVMQFIESREVGKQLIQTGELDFLWDLIEADLPEAETWEGVKISNPPSTGTERLLLNLADPEMDAPCVDVLRDNAHPHWALGDPLVREAIELGIDKQLIVDTLLFGFAPVGTTELNLGWGAPDIPASEYNPERAMELLEEAGWTDEDGDGVRECNGCPYAEAGRALKLKIQTTSGNALREQAEQVLQEMVAEIGIEFYIENVPSSELFGSYSGGAFRKHGQFDVLMYTTSYGTDPHSQMYGYYSSESIPCDDNGGKGYNYSRWIDDELDAALAIAGSNPDIEVRAAAYQTASERIALGRPHIYLYDRADIDLLVEDFMGYDMNIWESVSWNSEEWWLDR